MSGGGGRVSPYGLVFGSGLDSRFQAIRDEAAGRGVATEDLQQLVMLAAAGELLRELVPEESGGSSVLDAGRLVYHAYHFWLHGKVTFDIDPELLDRILDDPRAIGRWRLAAPEPAGYLRLPRNRVWSRVAEDAPWEAVDGVFWTVPAAVGGTTGAVDALVVLGLRPDRPGFGVIGVGAVVAEAEGHWGDIAGRDDGPDFGNVLPGGELTGLRSLVSEAEVLKLLSRFFHHVDRHPGSVTVEGEVRRVRSAGSDG